MAANRRRRRQVQIQIQTRRPTHIPGLAFLVPQFKVVPPPTPSPDQNSTCRHFCTSKLANTAWSLIFAQTQKTCSRPKTNCLSVLLSLRFHQFTCLTLSLPGFPVGERHWGEEIRSQRGKCGSGWNLSACAFITTRHCCQRNLLPCLLSTRLSISTSSSQPKKYICNMYMRHHTFK